MEPVDSSWPDLRVDPIGPEPRGPEVMRPVGARGFKGPEVFLIGPEPELCRVTGPELGPDRTGPELC